MTVPESKRPFSHDRYQSKGEVDQLIFLEKMRVHPDFINHPIFRLITSADQYYELDPPKDDWVAVAVFMDGPIHARSEKQKEKDAWVDRQLREMHIYPLRLPYRRLTERNMRAFAARVCKAINNPGP
jgi:hypothetical protein